MCIVYKKRIVNLIILELTVGYCKMIIPEYNIIYLHEIFKIFTFSIYITLHSSIHVKRLNWYTKTILFLYFDGIISPYSHSRCSECVLWFSCGAPVVWGPSPSLCLINQSCTGLQAAGLRCPQEQMCPLSPEQVSSARPCSEGLLRGGMCVWV